MQYKYGYASYESIYMRTMALVELAGNAKRCLQVYVLDNYLEIDIDYVPYENVSAVRERWLVLYDTTNKADEIM
jgi:hypothetical protein